MTPHRIAAPGGGIYRIKALAGDAAELLVYGDIGPDDDWSGAPSVSARAVVEALAQTSASRLTVRINSYGGIVADGLAIYSVLRRHPAAVTVEVDGVAASIASLIAMAGDTVRMAGNALLMVHAPWGAGIGNARDMRSLAEGLDAHAEAMVSAYERKTGRPREELMALLTDGEDHWFTAAEAVEAGFADEIAAEAIPIAAGDLTRFRSRPAAAAAFHRAPTMTENTTIHSVSGGDAVQAERERTGEIRAIAKHHPQLADAADEAIANGTSLDAFRAEIIPKLTTARPGGRDAGGLDMSRSEVERYSFLNVIRAQLDSKYAKHAGLELEASHAMAQKLGRQPQGMFIPYDVTRSPRAGLQKQTDSGGGYSVGVDHLGGSFIDVLRNATMVRRLGARSLGDLRGDVSIPRKTTGSTAYWVGEDGEPTEGTIGFGSILMAPKSVAGYIEYSRKLALQSSPDIETLVRTDLGETLGVEIDRAAINGSGIGAEPLGILNTTGIGDVAGGTDGAAPEWADIVDLEGEVAIDNAEGPSLAYLVNAATRKKLKKTLKVSGDAGAGFIWSDAPMTDGMGMINGHSAGVSNNMPSDLSKGSGTDLSAIIYGDWRQLMIGEWGGLDLLVDPYTLAKKGGFRVTAYQDVDIAVRYAEAFAAMADAVTT